MWSQGWLHVPALFEKLRFAGGFPRHGPNRRALRHKLRKDLNCGLRIANNDDGKKLSKLELRGQPRLLAQFIGGNSVELTVPFDWNNFGSVRVDGVIGPLA